MQYSVTATCPVCENTRVVQHANSKDIVRKCRPCARPVSIGKTYVDNNGYVRVYTKDGERYQHRYIWEQEYGPIPKDHAIHHLDGNRTNNDISNLRVMPKKMHDSLTSKEHWQKIKNGEAPFHHNPRSIYISKADIINYLKQGYSIRKISRKYNITHSCVRNKLKKYGINYKDYK